MMLSIERDFFYDGWVELLHQLLHKGVSSDPRGLGTVEHLGVSLRIKHSQFNILKHQERGLNYKFMVAEWLWIMNGTNDLECIARYNSEIRKFSDDGTFLAGAYGPRLIHQLNWLFMKLSELDTRQGVVTIWTTTPQPSKDIPCTVALQFLPRRDKIHLIVTMRSSDVWLGLPYDFFVFSQLLNCVCGVMKRIRGFVQFNLGSSHLYDSNAEQARMLTNGRSKGTTIYSPVVSEMPPVELYDILWEPAQSRVLQHPWTFYAKVLQSPRTEAERILDLAAHLR